MNKNLNALLEDLAESFTKECDTADGLGETSGSSNHDAAYATDYISEISEQYALATDIIENLMHQFHQVGEKIAPVDSNRNRMKAAEKVVYETQKVMHRSRLKLEKMAEDALDYDEKLGIDTYRQSKLFKKYPR